MPDTHVSLLGIWDVTHLYLCDEEFYLPAFPLRGFPQITLQLRLREEIQREGKSLAQP
jgi:hypothetical protein